MLGGTNREAKRQERLTALEKYGIRGHLIPRKSSDIGLVARETDKLLRMLADRDREINDLLYAARAVLNNGLDDDTRRMLAEAVKATE